MFNEYYIAMDNSTKGLKFEIVSPIEFRDWMQKYGSLLDFVILTLSIFDISAICIMFYVFSKSPQFHFHLIALVCVPSSVTCHKLIFTDSPPVHFFYGIRSFEKYNNNFLLLFAG